jgi:hypothetical protein
VKSGKQGFATPSQLGNAAFGPHGVRMTDIVDIAFQRDGDHAKDAGLAWYEIIHTEYDPYRHSELFAVQSVKDITLAEAEDILRELGEFARAA